MVLDKTHVTLIKLQELLPKATVVGGCFKESLPNNPKSLSREKRNVIFERIRKEATNQSISQFFKTTEIIKNKEDGSRNWPSGFTGSVTHKGTVVLAAISESKIFKNFGIDLEYDNGSDLSNVQNLILPENPSSPYSLSRTTLISLSIKEAIFKVQFSITNKHCSYRDISIISRP
ncbi:hypothetical protein BUQ74_20405 [Leptospira weilii serovar Heyan]|uniref:hypothetical protein n=1 Tax=Leptospira weilii TaxID=28184 RepID=UPI0007749B45|nr:hypothetical protein [Leptospira weilii]OMI14756.1 hypothetical protein BUQ74_20405 [Leptospira weilii serovar Heyan]